MTAPTISEYLKFANVQMAAEALYGFDATVSNVVLTPSDTRSGVPIDPGWLTLGNHHASKFTAIQAAEFAAQWTVVEHESNTPTGFSGTLLKNKTTNEYVMSFRSTEFLDDAARDNQATNTLEIKEKGWAFGQIDDMEAWYKHLLDTKLIPDGAKFSVTGYSLGGHLATAFNLLRREDGTQARIDKVVTFNGAGVGTIQENQGTLGSVMAYFNGLRNDSTKIDAAIQDAELKTVVANIRSHLAKSTWSLSTAKDAVYALNTPKDGSAPPTQRPPEQQMVLDALNRMEAIIKEATDAPKLTSGSTDPTTPPNPATIPISQIAQATFDYQMAVLLTGLKTKAFGIVDGLVQALTDGQIASDPMLNQFDVQGATSPSAVSNSQLHYGASVGIFIEDQPLKRGDYISEALIRSLSYMDIKLLTDKYSVNDFGDTHSLVLLVDSLNVQNTILQMLPADQRADAGATWKGSKGVYGVMQSILEQASNRVAVSGSLVVGGDQGKAEGDVLENTVNALADLVLGPGNGTRLNGSLIGGTWAVTNDKDGFSGRDSLYKLLNEIKSSDLFKIAADGAVSLQLNTSSNLATQARNDFGAYAALVSLSPFAFTLTDEMALASVGGKWGDAYTNWKADKDKVSSGDSNKAQYVTDQWLQDRAALLVCKDYYNGANASYDSSKPDAWGNKAMDGSGNAKAINTRFDAEDIVWDDHKSDTKVLRGTTTANTRYVVFANDKGESLEGDSRQDRLYG